MRETAVESHPFGFPLGFARGFAKTGQALFAKCAKKDGAPQLSSVRRPGWDARALHKLGLETEAPFEFKYAARQPSCGCTEQWV
jgi:hypothetical protein